VAVSRRVLVSDQLDFLASLGSARAQARGGSRPTSLSPRTPLGSLSFSLSLPFGGCGMGEGAGQQVLTPQLGVTVGLQ
jgi:hypothetical protein